MPILSMPFSTLYSQPTTILLTLLQLFCDLFLVTITASLAPTSGDKFAGLLCMGISCAGSTAHLFLERIWFSLFQDDRLLFSGRYIDDGIGVFTRTEVNFHDFALKASRAETAPLAASVTKPIRSAPPPPISLELPNRSLRRPRGRVDACEPPLGTSTQCLGACIGHAC